MATVEAGSRLWTYPWDVLDLGMDAFQAELRERAGTGGVSIATSYHAGFFLQPRSPRRRFYLPEDGVVYYAPDPARWHGRAIRPQAARLVKEQGDVLAALTRARAAGGAAVHAWTVCLHNMRLATAHPNAAARNAFGDRSPFALCPSHPEARAYVTTLVREIAERYAPEAIELETPSFMGFAHGYHHEKDGVGLTAEDDLLLSLCFCPACLDRAGRAGVEAAAARALTCELVREALARPVPQPRWPALIAQGPDACRDLPALRDYLLWRREPVTSLVAEARAAAGGHSRLHVIDFPGSWVLGVDLGQLAGACDGIVYCAYDLPPAALAEAVAAVRAVMPPAGRLDIGLQLFVPTVAGAADLAARCVAARRAGGDGFNFYNFGLVPAARLDWVRAALVGTGGR